MIRCENHESEERARKLLESKTEHCVLKGKTASKDMVELNLEIRLMDENTDFINEIADADGVQSAVLVSYNGDYAG